MGVTSNFSVTPANILLNTNLYNTKDSKKTTLEPYKGSLSTTNSRLPNINLKPDLISINSTKIRRIKGTTTLKFRE